MSRISAVLQASLRVRVAAVAAVALLLVGGTTIIAAAVATNNGPFNGCLGVKTVPGQIYRVTADGKIPACMAGDQAIAFSNAKGPSGAKGATGADGATGSAGPAGPRGATGADGAAGTDGTDGSSGPTGATGVGGTRGATGATGSDGTPGLTGATGDPGPAGATGPAGPKGDPGTGSAAADTCASGSTPLSGGTKNIAVVNVSQSPSYSSLVSQLAPTQIPTNGDKTVNCAGTLSGFSVTASGDPAIGTTGIQSYVITVRVNGSPSALACTVLEGSTTCTSPETIALAVGDVVNVEVMPNCEEDNPAGGCYYPLPLSFDWAAVRSSNIAPIGP